jgi:hypothetical protein
LSVGAFSVMAKVAPVDQRLEHAAPPLALQALIALYAARGVVAGFALFLDQKFHAVDAAARVDELSSPDCRWPMGVPLGA